jgi:hypothetical protein
LRTIFETFDNEADAVKSFYTVPPYCLCPVCGQRSEAPLRGGVHSATQRCSTCDCQFTIDSSTQTGKQVLVESCRIPTYQHEYFEIVSGAPFTVQIVGRLSLFSSSALKDVWRVLPAPRRVVFDLQQATEITSEGWDALAALLARKKKDDRAAVCIEGLSPERVAGFHDVSAIYASKAAALAALGDVSDTPRLLVKIVESLQVESPQELAGEQ